MGFVFVCKSFGLFLNFGVIKINIWIVIAREFPGVQVYIQFPRFPYILKSEREKTTLKKSDV